MSTMFFSCLVFITLSDEINFQKKKKKYHQIERAKKRPEHVIY